MQFYEAKNSTRFSLPGVHKAYERVLPVGKAGLVNVVGLRALPIRTGELKGYHLGKQTKT
jgi:hypothetical protein